jgi:sugar phosphate isomerase/epimerase
MKISNSVSRRALLSTIAAAPVIFAKGKKVPVGLELYSVRNELTKDLFGTVTAVAKLGYECVEFYSPYFQWTPAYAKDVRKLLDDLGVKCHSTHNGANSFTPENIGKATELNQIIGSKMIVMASAGRVEGIDGWKKVAERLSFGADQLKSAGMRAGFHNHQVEFKAIDGVRPMEVLAKNTPKNVVLQLDVGTCVEVGVDPVQWINQNPGRINSMHLKDWAPETGHADKGYKVLFGEGAAPWKKVLDAAEKKGGIEFYLIEQEGSRFTPIETAEKCLASYKKMRG